MHPLFILLYLTSSDRDSQIAISDNSALVRLHPMTHYSDVMDESDRYFLAEALELLASIEQDLLTLVDDPSPARIHSLMRAAHTLKGAAASVEQNAIQEVAHVLEDIFTALYSPNAVINDQVEALLFQGYECLRLLLSAASTGHAIDETDVLNRAASVIAQLQDILGDCFNDEKPVPSSADLGFDIVQSMFETGVTKRLNDLEQELHTAIRENHFSSLAAALRSHIEVLLGLAESLSMPGFGAIAQTTLDAIEAHPTQVKAIAQLALRDLKNGQMQVLSGDRTQGGHPSADLLQLAGRDFHSAATSVTSTASSTAAVADVDEPTLADELEFEIEDFMNEARSSSSASDSIDWKSAELETALEEGAWDRLMGENADPEEPDLADALETEIAQSDFEPDWPQDPLEAEFEITDFEIDLTHALADDDTDTDIKAVDSTADLRADSGFDSSFDTDSNKTEEHRQASEPSRKERQNESQSIKSPRSQNLIASQTHPVHTSDAKTPIPALTSTPARSKMLASTTSASATSSSKSSTPTSQTSMQRAAASIRVNVERLEALEHLAGDLLTQQTKQTTDSQQMLFVLRHLTGAVQQHLNTLQELQSQAERVAEAQHFQRRRSPLERLPSDSSTSPVNLSAQTLDRNAQRSENANFGLDTLELDDYSEQQILLQHAIDETLQIETALTAVDQIRKRTGHTLQLKKRLLTSLQDDITATRMQSLESLMSRFPRVLQQLISTYGKNAHLTLKGMDVLVDRIIVEKLYDPLLHLIRNAFDHGIESSDERRQLGKPEAGRIEIRAFSRGKRTVIEVSDDGRGADVNRIAEKAIALNLKTAEQVSMMTEAELLDLVFHPGFSTSAALSALSGRGVGLDVVRSQLDAIQGSVSIQSVAGRGTTFILHLPASLTVTQVLLFRVGVTVYAVPIDGVERVMCVSPHQFGRVHDNLVFQPAGPNGPTVRLHQMTELVNYSETAKILQQRSIATNALIEPFKNTLLPLHDSLRQILMIKTAAGTQGIEVDQILGEQELVVRSLSSVVPAPDYVQGCCVLGNNQLALVVDVVALLEPSQTSTAPLQLDPMNLASRQQAAISSMSSAEPSEDELHTELLMPESSENNVLKAPSPSSAVSSGAQSSLAMQSRNWSDAVSEPEHTQMPIPNVQASHSPSHVQPTRACGQSSHAGILQLPALLVVDDSATFRHVLSSSLERAGYQVLQAHDGLDAIAKLRQSPNKPVVVICDVEMPRLNGYQFLMQKAQDPETEKIPVVMLTSRSGEKHQKIAIELGASAYMTKPFDQKQLLETVNRLIQRSLNVGKHRINGKARTEDSSDQTQNYSGDISAAS